MSEILAQAGESVPFSLVIEDGNSSKYPQARVFDELGSPTPIASVNLTHLLDGYYYGSYTVPLAGKYIVVYTVYDDVGRTIPSPVYGRVDDLIVADIVVPSSQEIANMFVEAQFNLSYEDASQLVRSAVWMDRAGQTVADPVSASFVLRDSNDVVLLTMTSSVPFPSGVFYFQSTVPIFLADNRVYYVEVSVTDPLTTASTVQTFTTVG
jgi:hypothetical protein